MEDLNGILKEIRQLFPTTSALAGLDDVEEEIIICLRGSYDLLKIAEEQMNMEDINEGGDEKFQRITNILEEVYIRTKIVLDRTWEDLNTGHWSTVPETKRYVYSFASFIMVIGRTLHASLCANESDATRSSVKQHLEKGLKDADLGLLLGCALRSELTRAAQCITRAIGKCDVSNKVNEVILTPGHSLQHFSGVEGEQILTLSCPSLESFSSDHFYPRKPVKLTGCMQHWPALNRWNDIDYLKEKAGKRTVPIEIGSRYDDEAWSQSLMTLQDFIDEHVISKKCTKLGYLAQHQLFNQIPELLEDIHEPEYCCCSDESAPEGESTDINAWFGPPGTVSPLHFDPKHNILAQVVGRKRVLLYDPKFSDRLSCHESKLMSNTAQVDPEHPDYKKYPNYRDTPVLETILHPGEMLYIPPTWWHHIRSLDVSFSVSFWWR